MANGKKSAGGPRHNGPWSPVYGQAWDHEKTSRAVDFVVANDRKIPRDCAPSVVLGWLNRLNVWCLSNHEGGYVGALPDAKLAMVAWPEGVESRIASRIGATIRGALRAGGFLEGPIASEVIHEFRWHHRGILRKRDEKRELRGDGGDAPDDPDLNRPTKSHHSSPPASGDMSGDKSKMSPPLSPPLSWDSGSDRVGSGRIGAGLTVPAAPEPPIPNPQVPEPGPSTPPTAAPPDEAVTPAGLAATLTRVLRERPDDCAKAVGELLASDVEPAWLRDRIATHDPANTVGVWSWKRTALAAWHEEHPRKVTNGRPEKGPASPEFNPERIAERERDNAKSDALAAEFATSGYTSRLAWAADRKAGELRTGDAAARRGFEMGRGAFDAPSDADTTTAACSRERHAPLTCRRPVGNVR